MKRVLILTLCLLITLGFYVSVSAASTVAKMGPVMVTGDASFDSVFEEGIFFNLVAERLEYEKTADNSMAELTTAMTAAIGGYSLDGGNKWVSGSPTAAIISKALAKEMTLVLVSELDGKQPASTAAKATFPKIEKRPATDKMKIDYGIITSAINTNGMWGLINKDGSTVTSTTLEYIVPADGKKLTATDTEWNEFDPAVGIAVKDMTA